MNVDLDVIAGHEAAHAVMQYLCGLPATELFASPEGGYCAATGKRMRVEDELRIILAGIAWETDCGFTLDQEARADLLARSSFADLNNARALLADYPYVRPFVQRDGAFEPSDVETALLHQFNSTCDLLWPCSEVVETLSQRLIDHGGRLSARKVAAWCRENIER